MTVNDHNVHHYPKFLSVMIEQLLFDYALFMPYSILMFDKIVFIFSVKLHNQSLYQNYQQYGNDQRIILKGL